MMESGPLMSQFEDLVKVVFSTPVTTNGETLDYETSKRIASGILLRLENKSFPSAKIGAAEWRIMNRFRKFAATVQENEFFDPRNNSDLMREFGYWLVKQSQGVSND